MAVRRWAGLVALPVLVLAGVGPGAGRPGPQRPHLDATGATVTVYGREGAFGALGDRLPSGQRLGRVAVAGWGLPPGWQANAIARAADGSLVVGGRPADPPDGRTAATGPVVSIVDPRTQRPTALRLDGAPERAAVVDLDPVGDAVVALVGSAPAATPAAGPGPALVGLSRLDGRWRAGPPVPLAAACRGCPDPTGLTVVPGSADVAVVPGSADVAVVPGSADVIVTWPAGGDGNGALVALRLAGPDRAGRLAATVVARHPYPRVADPTTADPDDRLSVSPTDVQVAPRAGPGPRRLAVGLEVRGAGGRYEPSVLQEFGYDARAGTIRPLSAPILAGDRVRGLDRRPTDVFYAYGARAYDRDGNLWVARTVGLGGGALAGYAHAPGRANVGGPDCAYRRAADDLTRAGGRTVWGRTCRPDYDILQTAAVNALEGIVVDPATGDLVGLALGGVALLIRTSGSGRAMRFAIGNAVDLGLKLLPGRPATLRREWPVAVDPGGRLWLLSSYFDGSPGTDHWLFSVRLADLLDPPPVPLPDVPGRMALVQAEQTRSTGTSQRPGGSGRAVVDSDAYVAGCLTWAASNDCGHDFEPGDGLLVRDDTGFGHLTGDLVYRVRVPVAGRYRPVFRAAVFPTAPAARIALTVAGRTVTTAVPPLGRWITLYADDEIDLPSGVHTVRVAPADRGAGGWALNWFGLERR